MILEDIEIQEKLSALNRNIKNYELSDAIKISTDLGKSYCKEMEVARKESLKFQEEERHLVAPRYSTKEGKKWSEFARDLGDKLFTDKAHPFYGSLEDLEGNEFNTRAIDEIVQTLEAVSDRDIAAAESKKPPSTMIEYRRFEQGRTQQLSQTYNGVAATV